MALDLTTEQKETGRANFQRVVGEYSLNRRDFMKGMLAAGAALPLGAAAYFGYQHEKLDRPVRAFHRTRLAGIGAARLRQLVDTLADIRGAQP